MRPREHHDIRRTAYHEAGHTVVMLHKNEPFLSVWVRRDLDEPLHHETNERARKYFDKRGEGLLGCVNTHHGYETTLVSAVTMLLAGIAGVCVSRGERWATLTNENLKQDDVKGAKKILRKAMLVPAGAFLENYLARAHQLLVDHAAAHKAIAEALIEKGSLTYAEAKEIFERNN